MAKYDYQIWFDNKDRMGIIGCDTQPEFNVVSKGLICITASKNERYLVNMAHVLFVKEIVHDETETTEQENENDILDTNLADYKFSVRTKAVFKLNDLVTIRDLVRLRHKDFIKLRNMSNTVILEVQDFMIEHDLCWSVDI